MLIYNEMYIAATKFHFHPPLKFQLLTDVTSNQFYYSFFITNSLNIFQSIVKFIFKVLVGSLFGVCHYIEINLLSKKS